MTAAVQGTPPAHRHRVLRHPNSSPCHPHPLCQLSWARTHLCASSADPSICGLFRKLFLAVSSPSMSWSMCWDTSACHSVRHLGHPRPLVLAAAHVVIIIIIIVVVVIVVLVVVVVVVVLSFFLLDRAECRFLKQGKFLGNRSFSKQKCRNYRHIKCIFVYYFCCCSPVCEVRACLLSLTLIEVYFQYVLHR
jgi:hypothetical protein